MRKQLLSLAVGIATLSTTAIADDCNYAEFNVTTPGTLASLMGEDSSKLDSLVITGTINADDIATMRMACFDRRLAIINLENATIEGNKLPNDAFASILIDNAYYTPYLEKIFLPEGLEEIGTGAFQRAIFLKYAKLPSTLKNLGKASFLSCKSLGQDELVIPEGVTAIPSQCFAYCNNIGKVTLPSTLKEIGAAAFYMAGVKEINLPDGLEKIELMGLEGSLLTTLTIPGTCKQLGYSTIGSATLKKLVIGEGIETLPDMFATDCSELEELILPNSLTELKKESFRNAHNLTNLTLPEGLKRVEGDAFIYSNVKTLVIPSTVEYLASHSFLSNTLEAIYMKPVTPPATDFKTSINTIQQDINPFCFLNGRDAPFCNVPMYVPVGTKAAYLASTAWSFMTNIIETDTFPGEAGVEGIDADNSPAVTIIAGNGCALITNNSATPQPYVVYTLDGRSMAAGTLTAGETSVQLSAGLYIVKAGNETAKISVH